MLDHDKIIAIRAGGNVTRSHTFQYQGTYNVAIHSYNALSMLLVLHKTTPPSLNLIKVVLWHDVHERWTGDLPTPVKWVLPEIESVLKKVEQQIEKKLELFAEELTEEEQRWLKAIDILEFYIWTVEQVSLGNDSMKGKKNKVIDFINGKFPTFPIEVITYWKNHKWREFTELVELLQEVK